ncbi:MAG: hypothetical protein CM1200mP15_17170 [Dehalococcoidia bacterium]|nr:MAG: hypothetical protein CM1200mP15_17170 [Dehalococcoidia bacterium]
MIKGNDALCLGAVAAGLNFYIGYPISPATTIFIWMERNLVGPGNSRTKSVQKSNLLRGFLEEVCR